MGKLLSVIIKYKNIVLNNLKIYKNNLIRKFQIKRIINENNLSNVPCPICENSVTLIWSYTWENKKLKKYLCPNCEHIFSNWLNNDLVKIQSLFDYSKRSTHNHKSIVEEKVLEKNIKYFNSINGYFLDFGIGANYFIVEKMSQRYPQHEIWGCDLNYRNEKNYFQTYNTEGVLNKFDGISSHAVIEHLDDTVNSWKYFNRLLKNNKNSRMIHAFPSQIHFHLNEWSIKIPEHVCVFSKKSLKILCDKTGFKLEKIEIRDHHHPIFIFKKIRAID